MRADNPPMPAGHAVLRPTDQLGNERSVRREQGEMIAFVVSPVLQGLPGVAESLHEPGLDRRQHQVVRESLRDQQGLPQRPGRRVLRQTLAERPARRRHPEEAAPRSQRFGDREECLAARQATSGHVPRQQSRRCRDVGVDLHVGMRFAVAPQDERRHDAADRRPLHRLQQRPQIAGQRHGGDLRLSSGTGLARPAGASRATSAPGAGNRRGPGGRRMGGA